jgi:Ion channel
MAFMVRTPDGRQPGEGGTLEVCRRGGADSFDLHQVFASFRPWKWMPLITALVGVRQSCEAWVAMALAYAIAGVAPAGSDLLFFAFVDYTTLGYGDITPVETWRLTGSMTAMNGILMFGWSMAALFEVLRKTLEHLR